MEQWKSCEVGFSAGRDIMVGQWVALTKAFSARCFPSSSADSRPAPGCLSSLVPKRRHQIFTPAAPSWWAKSHLLGRVPSVHRIPFPCQTDCSVPTGWAVLSGVGLCELQPRPTLRKPECWSAFLMTHNSQELKAKSH